MACFSSTLHITVYHMNLFVGHVTYRVKNKNMTHIKHFKLLTVKVF
jgi:hypothetical protein